MNTIKIIDLLNKIANGEEVPKEIKVNDNIYHYDETDCNEFYRYRTMTNELLTDYADLNDEVEIIEEKKIPEKLEDISEIKCVGCKVEINIAGNKTLFDTDTPIVTEHCIYKINQLIKNQKKIIDYLKSKEKGE